MSVKIKKIQQNPYFKKGDIIIKIDNNKINDILDFYFYIEQNEVLKIEYNNNDIIKIKTDELKKINLELEEFKIRKCCNKCIFCFCDQHPKNVRQSLLFKDDDFRMSFLYGNYITLTNLSEKDYEKIIKLRLSPLYISVHTVNDDIRRKILNVNYKYKILDKLKYFADNNINFNCQIVVIPDYNDKDLLNTVNKLLDFFPVMQSIAIVPVGLTKHRRRCVSLKTVSKVFSKKLIYDISKIQEKNLEKYGTRIVFLADEFYVKAGIETPYIDDYEELLQIEDGIGLQSLFRDEFYYFLPYYKNRFKKNKIAVLTGEINYKLFTNIFNDINKKYKTNLIPIFVKNTIFGSKVTVTGLLTGYDIKKILDKINIIEYEKILLPDITLRYEKDIFLDDMNYKDLKEQYKKLKLIDTSAKKLLFEMTR